MTTVRKALLAAAAVAAIASWAAPSVYLAGGPLDLLPFVVPGAIFGVWLAWLAHAFARRLFTWRRGLIGAVLGALILPPWLAAIVVVAADFGSAQLVTVLAAGAWIALVAGLVLAIGFAVPVVRRHRHRRRAARQAAKAHHPHAPPP